LPSGELAFVKHLSIDRSSEGKKITWVEPDCESVLFGWPAIDPEAREATITEGEIDAMTAWDYGWRCRRHSAAAGVSSKVGSKTTMSGWRSSRRSTSRWTWTPRARPQPTISPIGLAAIVAGG
jgi:hypothetical protein